jgi:hypothetical protein
VNILLKIIKFVKLDKYWMVKIMRFGSIKHVGLSERCWVECGMMMMIEFKRVE